MSHLDDGAGLGPPVTTPSEYNRPPGYTRQASCDGATHVRPVPSQHSGEALPPAHVDLRFGSPCQIESRDTTPHCPSGGAASVPEPERALGTHWLSSSTGPYTNLPATERLESGMRSHCSSFNQANAEACAARHNPRVP